MRLVYYNPTGIVGGAEMCLLDLLAALQAGRPDWSLNVLLGDDGPLREAVEGLGVGCDVLPMPAGLASMGDAGLGLGPGGARRSAGVALARKGPAAGVAAAGYLRRLRRRLEAEAPDLVQTNGMKAHVLGTLAAPRGVPVVWQMHDYLSARPLMARLLRYTARARRSGGLTVVGVSRSVADDAAAVLGPGVAVVAIYNAVDLDRFSPGPGDGPRLDAMAGLPAAPEGTVRVGLVATYARWKGHEVFLEAAARLPADAPARFYVVGSPLYRSAGSQYSDVELREAAGRLGLAGRVGFVPHQDAPEAVFRALDVVVHASTKPEPFGRVIVEAMACGRAVVAAPVGGAAELFEDGVSALGCPPGDPSALASALSRLAADPGLRRALGAKGRAEAEARFDRTRLAPPWAAVYAGRAAG